MASFYGGCGEAPPRAAGWRRRDCLSRDQMRGRPGVALHNLFAPLGEAIARHRRNGIGATLQNNIPRTRMSQLGHARRLEHAPGMSASLIGRLGSSTFRLSTTTGSMSLASWCFSSESAPRPFHHGIRKRGRAISWGRVAATADDLKQALAAALGSQAPTLIEVPTLAEGF
jgi:hypothetical protein